MDTTTTPPSHIWGCDVGKNEIVVFDGARLRRIANRPEALAAFVRHLDRDGLIVCEATGGYELPLLAAALDAGVPAHRADARKVKAFIRSFGTLGKTDAIDARALRRYGYERHAGLTLWRARDEDRVKLQSLVLVRRDLVEDRRCWQNRRDAPGAEALSRHFDEILAVLKRQIVAIDAEIRALTENAEPLAEANQALVAVEGIGRKTSAAMLGLLPELGTVANKQIVALSGLAPHPDQSGTEDRYRKTRGGRAEVKRTLFMAAMAASRSHPTLSVFYKRLLANGKKKLVALTAVMRKLVVIANAVVKQVLAARAARTQPC
jgi:transposase